MFTYFFSKIVETFHITGRFICKSKTQEEGKEKGKEKGKKEMKSERVTTEERDVWGRMGKLGREVDR